MALSLGSLYVSLNADASGLVKDFSKATKAVEKFAKDVKRGATELASVGTALTAVGGAALALASTVDGQTKRAMDGLKASGTALAVEVSRTLLPAVKALTDQLRAAADWFAGLSPETKEAISRWAVLAVQAGALAMALGRVATLGATAAGALSGIAKAVAAFGVGPLLGVVAAVAAIAAAVAALHAAWRTNWGGIKDYVRKFLQWFSDAWNQVFGDLGDTLDKWAIKFLSVIERTLANASRVSKAAGKENELFGAGAMATKKELEAMRKTLEQKGLGGVVKSIVQDMADTGAAAGRAFVDEWKQILKDMGLDSILDKKGKSHSGTAPKELAGFGGGVDSSNFMSLNKAAAKQLEQAEARRKASRISPTSVAKFDKLSTLYAADYWKAVEGKSTWQRFSDAAGKFADEWKERFLKAGTDIAGAAHQAAGTIMSRMGEVGGVINSVVQGFQSGGVWGAIIALIAEVITRLEGFAQVVEWLNATFKQTIGNISKHTQGLFDGISKVAESIHKVAGALEGALGSVLKPIFDLVGQVLGSIASLFEPLVPVLEALGEVLKPIGALFQVIGLALDALKPVLIIVGTVLKVVALVVMGIMYAMASVWNGILTFIYNLLTHIDPNAAKELSGSGIFANTAKMKEDMDKLALSIAEPFMGPAQQLEVAGTGAAAGMNAAADAANQFAESLSNVPTGYKVAAARFAATQAVGSGWDVFQSPKAPIVIENLTIQADDPKGFLEKLKVYEARSSFRQRGTTVPEGIP